MLFPAHLLVEQSKNGGHDRALLCQYKDSLIIAVADGSGGQGGGGEAADKVIAGVKKAVANGIKPGDYAAWCSLLVDIDREIEEDKEAGETTAIVLALSRRYIAGAACGDSRALLFSRTGLIDITKKQNRRPMLGSGGSLPVPINERSLVGTLVVATDGLFDYMSAKALEKCVSSPMNIDERAKSLVESLRLKSGDLPDDVALALIDTL